jgi:hypothetical protein
VIVAGIDPGIEGGIAVVNGFTDCETMDMPIHDVGELKRINAPRLSEFLSSRDVEFAVVERVHGRGIWGAPKNFRFGGAFFDVLAVLDMLAIPFTTVPPKEWQEAMGVTADKLTSRRRATEMLPRAYQQFELVKDAGKAEAALLALWWLYRRLRGEGT